MHRTNPSANAVPPRMNLPRQTPGGATTKRRAWRNRPVRQVPDVARSPSANGLRSGLPVGLGGTRDARNPGEPPLGPDLARRAAERGALCQRADAQRIARRVFGSRCIDRRAAVRAEGMRPARAAIGNLDVDLRLAAPDAERSRNRPGCWREGRTGQGLGNRRNGRPCLSPA